MSSFLYIGMTFAVFSNSGKIPSLIDLLKMITSPGIISSLTYFNMLILKTFRVDFLGFSLSISVQISFSSAGVR